MMLSSVTVPLLGMVDTGVVGHLDSPVYLGAVAAGATIFNVIFMSLNFLRMATTGVAAQAHGADDQLAVRESLGQSVGVAVLLAFLILVAQVPIGAAALTALGTSDAVSAQAAIYFGIRVWSAPAALVNFAIIGWLIGIQNARGALLVTLAINVTNIALDLLFVVGLGYGVAGVAAATVCAEIAGLAMGTLLVRSSLAARPGRWVMARLKDWPRYRRLLSMNWNLFIRTVALMFVFAWVTAQGARMGDLVLAANAVLLNFQWFLSYALDGIANAAESLVGRAVGARDRAGLKRAVRRTLVWTLVFAAAFTLFYVVAGRTIINVLTTLPDVRSAAYQYLPWLIASPLVSAWCFLYDGVFVGATWPKAMRNVMVVSTLAIFLPAWYGLAPLYGNHALWFAFLLFLGARGVGMHVLFRRRLRGFLVETQT